MIGQNNFRMVHAGPLRRMADGGRVSAFDVIREELPKWWNSDETADLRKGLRQTGLGAAYAFGPGLPMLPSVGAELYDAFARNEEDVKNAPTLGSFSWLEKKLGRDLHDPREEQFALASGLAQASPMLKLIPKIPGAIGKIPSAIKSIPSAVNSASDFIAKTIPSTSNTADQVFSPATQRFLEL